MVAKDVDHNEINPLWRKSRDKQLLPKEKALVQIPTHGTLMKENKHCAQQV